MDYDLTRIDYTICGITFPDTLKVLLGRGPKTQQNFIVGDKNGVLQCLGIKDEEPVVYFKTLPGKPITTVQLAATAGSPVDKIFVATGNEVKGYTRKGKVFLTIETTLSETITSMYVVGSDLILCSGRTVTYYRDLQEHHTYVCEDRVLDIAAFMIPNSTKIRLLILIANKGAGILEGGQFVTHAAISSGPTRLLIPTNQHSSNLTVFYGAADGSIGLITYEQSVLSSKCLVEGQGLGSVVCMGWYIGTSGTHLAVGRHDGSIQLYLVDLENLDEKPRLKFTYFCGEPVTSVTGGCIGTEENELLAATFSGRIFALRSRRLISGAVSLANIPQDALASRRAKLEAEIARLEKQTASEREKYQRNTRSIQSGLSAPPLLDVQHELSGATREGWQEAKITSAVPLDMLFIYCSKKLDLLTDTAAVLSLCPSQGAASDTLATVRCQAGTRRLWIRLRSAKETSSQHKSGSSVIIYVLPAGAPRVARAIALKLPALPYYWQHEDLTVEPENRAWCEVRLSGAFSVPELTSWLTEILPGELPRPSAEVSFARSDTLLGTILICRYQRGNAVFKTDNISTAAVIKDVIVNCSVDRNNRMDISCDVPKKYCIKSFQRIEDQYKSEFNKHKDVQLRKAISALDLGSDAVKDDSNNLCQEYLRVMHLDTNDSDEPFFKELVESILQWYIDWKNLSSHASNKDYENENIRLKNALENCKMEEILGIFSPNRNKIDKEEFY